MSVCPVKLYLNTQNFSASPWWKLELIIAYVYCVESSWEAVHILDFFFFLN